MGVWKKSKLVLNNFQTGMDLQELNSRQPSVYRDWKKFFLDLAGVRSKMLSDFVSNVVDVTEQLHNEYHKLVEEWETNRILKLLEKGDCS